MVITLVTTYYDQVLQSGADDVFFKIDQFNLFLIKERLVFLVKFVLALLRDPSLDDIEQKKIIPLLGTTGQLALFRGAEEFLIPYTTAFRSENLSQRLDELAYEHVNINTFYDDFPGNSKSLRQSSFFDF